MKDKEKQIEEMAKIMRLHICKDRPCKECDCHGLGDKTSELYHCDCYYYAEKLYEQGYQKYEKDSVILPKKLYELYMNEFNNYEVGKRNGSKETAEKILNDFIYHYGTFFNSLSEKQPTIYKLGKCEFVSKAWIIDYFAKQFGVEIKEKI